MTYEYLALFESDGNGWTATVPDLPGCFSDSDTLEGAQAAIKDAVRLWIETAARKGWPLPAPRAQAQRIAV